MLRIQERTVTVGCTIRPSLTPACARPVPEAVPPGPTRGQSVPELPAGRADHALVRLHARQLARPPAHLPALHVAGLGPGSRPLSRSVACCQYSTNQQFLL